MDMSICQYCRGTSRVYAFKFCLIIHVLMGLETVKIREESTTRKPLTTSCAGQTAVAVTDYTQPDRIPQIHIEKARRRARIEKKETVV